MYHRKFKMTIFGADINNMSSNMCGLVTNFVHAVNPRDALTDAYQVYTLNSLFFIHTNYHYILTNFLSPNPCTYTTVHVNVQNFGHTNTWFIFIRVFACRISTLTHRNNTFAKR